MSLIYIKKIFNFYKDLKRVVYALSCVYSGRIGKIRVLSFKVGVILLSRAKLVDKWKCKLLYLLLFTPVYIEHF